MRIFYIKNESDKGSPYCNVWSWQGWVIEFKKNNRILVRCDKPDDTAVGCMVKGVLEIDSDESMLEVETPRSSLIQFTNGQIWSFFLSQEELKPIFCAMLDMAFWESGVTVEEFKEYDETYRSKEAQPD